MPGRCRALSALLPVAAVSLACAGVGGAPECADGESWVPDKGACVCLEPEICGPEEQASPCIGTWTGSLKDNRSSYTATIELTVTAPTEPSIEDPEGGKCGELEEKWGGGGNCGMVFGGCTVGEKVVGIAWPRPVMDCDKSNFELDCTTGAFKRIERSDGYTVMGTLSR